MKFPQHSRKPPHHKKSAPPKPRYVPDHFDEEIESDDLSSNPDQMPGNQPQEDFRTPEQVKIELAKKLIKKTKSAF